MAGPLFLGRVLAALAAAQLLARDHRPETARDALDSDLPDQLVERHARGENSEEGEYQAGDDDRDGAGREGIEQILEQIGGALESAEARKANQDGEIDEQEQQKANGVGVKAERPHLHRHHQRQGEQQGPAKGARQAHGVSTVRHIEGLMGAHLRHPSGRCVRRAQ